MISEDDKNIIADLARRYQVERVFLFGSALDSDKEARDIDLAIEGFPPEFFFSFYGDLIFGLSKPVDLVDLTGDTRFNRLIRREGKIIYG